MQLFSPKKKHILLPHTSKRTVRVHWLEWKKNHVIIYICNLLLHRAGVFFTMDFNHASCVCLVKNKTPIFLSSKFYNYRQSPWTCTISVWKCTALNQSQLILKEKLSCDWLRGVHFHAKIVHFASQVVAGFFCIMALNTFWLLACHGILHSNAGPQHPSL